MINFYHFMCHGLTNYKHYTFAFLKNSNKSLSYNLNKPLSKHTLLWTIRPCSHCEGKKRKKRDSMGYL